MNNTTFDDFCHANQVYQESTLLKIVLVLELLLGSVSAFGNGLLMIAVWRVKVFHANLRWLLINLSLNLFWYAGATALKAGHFLTICTLGDPCSLIVKSLPCKIWELAYITPFLNTIYSLMAVGLERLVSTIRYKTYDKSSKMPWLAFLFVPAIWIGTLGNQVAVLATLPSQLLPICLSFLFTPTSAVRATILTNLGMEVAALILISLLYLWNTHKRDRVVNVTYLKKEYSLASRFQIIQNVNVNKLLLPSIIAHACAHVPYNVFLVLTLTGLHFNVETKVILMHCSYVWFVAYGIIHAWLAFSRHPQLKEQLRQWAPKLLAVFGRSKHQSKVHDGSPTAVADVHFNMLSKQWS